MLFQKKKELQIVKGFIMRIEECSNINFVFSILIAVYILTVRVLRSLSV
jgi:hypothetical protein